MRMTKKMSLDTKIRIAKFKMLFKKKEDQISPVAKEIQKIAFAIVVMEFLLASGFYMLVKHDIYPLKREVIGVERVQASNGGVVEEDMATAKQVITNTEYGGNGSEELDPLTVRLEELVDTIYLKESSKGRNDQKCERLGENSHNGYGYRQGVNKNYCLESDEAMRKLVIEDLKVKIDRYPNATDTELLCLYNTGTLSASCNY